MMIFRYLMLLTVFIMLPCSVFAEDEAISELYQQSGISGTLLIESLDEQQRYVHDARRAEQRFIPASTFKVPHALIALEEGVIDAEQLIVWDGKKRWLSSWNQDQTLATSMSRSCVWCYQRFTESMSDTKYRIFLRNFTYGNKQTGPELSTFWLNGDLAISAKEQVIFFKKLYYETLPIASKHMQTVKDLIILEKTSTYTLYGKTGYAGDKIGYGWFVGYVETNDKVWFFANQMDIPDSSALKLRQQLVLDALKLKGIL